MLFQPRLLILVALLTIGLTGATWGPESPIGYFTAVEGDVVVTHPINEVPLLVKQHDNVLFNDLIETGHASRMKASLDDETVLTLAEESRLQITEHLYDPKARKRSAVLRLVRGKVRAMVSRMFGGSKFEIHTPSAIMAARGTYFVSWINKDGSAGIANIGDHGDVAFTSGGREVIVKPGEYSAARKAGVPSPPADVKRSPAAIEAINATEVAQALATETSKDTLTAMGWTVGRLGRDLLLPLKPVLGPSLMAVNQVTGGISEVSTTPATSHTR